MIRRALTLFVAFLIVLGATVQTGELFLVCRLTGHVTGVYLPLVPADNCCDEVSGVAPPNRHFKAACCEFQFFDERTSASLSKAVSTGERQSAVLPPAPLLFVSRSHMVVSERDNLTAFFVRVSPPLSGTGSRAPPFS